MTKWKKKLQQNSTKPNLAKYIKNHGSWPIEIYPKNAKMVQQKKINVIYFSNWIKDKNYITISPDTGKAFLKKPEQSFRLKQANLKKP